VAKLRRFAVPSLEGAAAGTELILSPEETRHARVLRLASGTEIELFDSHGISARATIQADSKHGLQVFLSAVHNTTAARPKAIKLVLATAWPKGKRAAVLVEKCAELGVDELVPVAFARSVVSKDNESEGITRLRRIALEASKQSGRRDVMRIASEVNFLDLLHARDESAMTLLLHPGATEQLIVPLLALPESIARLTLIVGPEGGLSDDELALAARAGVVKVRMAANVLRIETAALAACAICRACLDV
jgi:16S rRNA (uracil1498-N3)-methyltransferase